VVEPHEIDLATVWTSPSGDVVGEGFHLGGRRETRPVSVRSTDAGTYRLEVRAASIPASAQGRYELTLAEVRPLAADDPPRQEAERALTAAWRRLYDPAARSGDLEAVLAGCRSALERWREWGDRARQAETLQLIGRLQRQRADNRAALAAFAPALDLARELGDRTAAADLLNQTGLAHAALGATDQALAAYAASLEIWRELGDTRQEARLLNNLGMVQLQLGRPASALDSLQRALEIFRRLGDRDQELAALNNLGGLNDALGEPLAAMDFYRRSLALARERGRREDEANALNNLGVSASRLGEAGEAFEHYATALDLFRSLGEKRREASTLNNLGDLLLRLGAPERAREPLEQALAIAQAAGDPVREAAVLHNLSRAAADLGSPEEAEALLSRTLALQRRAGHRGGEAWTLRRQGWVRNLAGRPARAIEPLGQALALFAELGDRTGQTAVHQELGRARAALGESAAALASFQEALGLATAGGDVAARADALQEIARLEAARGDLLAARGHLATALQDFESLRARVAGDPLRTAHFAAVRGAYELSVDILMRLHRAAPDAGWDRLAFEEAERGRARGLLDLLRQAGVAAHRAEPELIARERSLRQRINAKAGLLVRGERSPGPEGAAERELAGLLTEYQVVEARLEARDPEWADLRSPVVRTADVQGGLDRETLLLAYFLGEPRSYLWAVSSGALAGFVLPERKEIETAAGRAHALLSRLDASDRAAQEEALASLSALLLGPVSGRLSGKRLAIVADGALEYLPFAALPEPGTPGSTGKAAPLLDRHEVVRLPSATVLRELRRVAASRPPSTGRVAVLADPLFRSDDPQLVPLPWTRREAEAIAAAAQERSVLLALGAEANRALVTGPELARYGVVHFATHGLLDSRSPELSGLVLAQAELLSLADVYHLDLSADLVVLSGCRTALGTSVRGEGLVGLTRGFFHAGASRVMASLWPVRDQATAELMARFYQAYLRDGLTPAAALRQAQRRLREKPQWRDPYYWSPFVLQGDWQ
jgi:CHAT domain-containing protein/tetratricopeptide (TPR) repeat protein